MKIFNFKLRQVARDWGIKQGAPEFSHIQLAMFMYEFRNLPEFERIMDKHDLHEEITSIYKRVVNE